MSALNRMIRFVTYPYVRTSESLAGFKRSVAGTAREMSERHQVVMARVRQDEGDETPAQTFERVYGQGGWNKSNFHDLARALKYTRRVQMAVLGGLSLASLLIAGLNIGTMPFWQQVIFLIVGFGAGVMCFAQCFRYALMVLQIEKRTFLSGRDLLSSEDMWRRMFF